MIGDLIKASIGAAVVLAFLTTLAFANDSVCPPKRYFCWQVKIASATFGEAAVESRARSCGWTEGQIAAARRCLKSCLSGCHP